MTYHQIITKAVQADVEFVALFPEAELVCDPGSGLIYKPLGIVAITFPATATINGFIFASEFISDETWEPLRNILDPESETWRANCKDPELRLKFDEGVQEIIDSILGGTVDSETQANIDRLLHLGRSIVAD